MVKPLQTNSATRFMFIFNDETIFCTSDLDHMKAAVTHNDIGQFSSGEPVKIFDEEYEIEGIGIEHYSWPTNLHEARQTGTLYDYTINITIHLKELE